MNELNFKHKAVMQKCGVCEHCLYENYNGCYYKSCEEGVEKQSEILKELGKLKVCTNGLVDGLTDGKFYNVENVYVRDDGKFYEVIDDYGMMNSFKAEKFSNRKPKYKVGDRIICSVNNDKGTILAIDEKFTLYSRNYCIDFDNTHWDWMTEEEINLITE